MEGEISVGAWGGHEGNCWSYIAKCGIKQIIIHYGWVIDSIIFNGDAGDQASTQDCSVKFGGQGGSHTAKIDIDFPFEYVTGITLSHGNFEGFDDVVKSLKIHTNKTQHGPFGRVDTKQLVSFNAEGGVITGFHGRMDKFLVSIGVFMKPACLVFKTVVMKPQSSSDIISANPPRLLARSPGPWGSIDGGRVWDDGVFSSVKEVNVYVSLDVLAISGIQFKYEMKDGTDFSSPNHGNAGSVGNVMMEKFKIDGKDEFLIGVDGFYKPMDGVDVITSLTFHTNKGKYGRIGFESGKYFNSMSSMASHGKVVGFFGCCGAYLNAIGIHTEYTNHIFS